MTTPLSVRFDPGVLARLRRTAAERDTTPSGLVQRLVDEGLRAQEFPGITFRSGPSGRRAGIVAGPDVWELIDALRTVEPRGDAAVAAVAVDFDLSEPLVRTALAYYGTYTGEIDDEIDANERAADEAQQSWETQRRVLA